MSLAITVCFLLYLLSYAAVGLFLDLLAFLSISRHLRRGLVGASAPTGFEPPISVIVPAHNERRAVAESILSLVRLRYAEHEVIVVNDGSSDETLDVLAGRFRLRPFPEAYRTRIPTAPIRGVYQSEVYPNLRVIDKEKGGKADALNAGINAARYPLFCAVDADSILQPDSLQLVVQPFLERPETVAAGGTIRVVNGCEVRRGFLHRPRLPHRLLSLFQVVEYIRAFLFGRAGWGEVNGVLALSGAFSVFRKELVIRLGGYSRKTLTEDLEIVTRIHRHFSGARAPYRVAFVPEPVCWTEVPEDIPSLYRQRMRWQHGLAEGLTLHFPLCMRPGSGAVGWLSYPFQVLFEWLGPVFVLLGYLYVGVAYLAGMLSLEALATFLSLEIGFGILLSVTSLFLEQISFRVYPRARQVLTLAGMAVLENLGYRQMTFIWRLQAVVRWARGEKAVWGLIRRRGLARRKVSGG